MKPEDVYVVWDRNKDEIVSVHSDKEIAKIEKKKISKKCGITKDIFDRFEVVDLSKAITWIIIYHYDRIPED
jgi:hypothetical protein